MLSIPKATYETHYLHGNFGPIKVYKKIRKALRKGEKNRRIIKTIQIGGYEFYYHATRGWKKFKIQIDTLNISC